MSMSNAARDDKLKNRGGTFSVVESGDSCILSLRQLDYRLLKFETGRDRVLVKHADRIER